MCGRTAEYDKKTFVTVEFQRNPHSVGCRGECRQRAHRAVDGVPCFGLHVFDAEFGGRADRFAALIGDEVDLHAVHRAVAVEHRIFVGRAAVGDAADQLHGLRHRQSVDQHSLADAGVTGRRVDLRPECVGRAADLPVGSGIVLVAGRAARCGTEYDGALFDEPGDLVQQLRSHGLQFG